MRRPVPAPAVNVLAAVLGSVLGALAALALLWMAWRGGLGTRRLAGHPTRPPGHEPSPDSDKPRYAAAAEPRVQVCKERPEAGSDLSSPVPVRGQAPASLAEDLPVGEGKANLKPEDDRRVAGPGGPVMAVSASLTSPPLDEPGWAGPAPVLAGYAVLGRLGRGRSVWLAEETAPGLRGRVAVRVGRPEAAEGPLLREVESLSRVRSPHVAAYRHCLRAADGVRAVVVEYVPGEPLAAVLAAQPGGRLPWRAPSTERGGASSSSELSAGGVITGVLRGLAALHTAEPPIVHRGLTPANILVCGGRAVLTDICLLALAVGPEEGPGDDVESLSPGDDEAPRGAEGTGGYMSPELAEGAVGLEGLDARADVWAAGVVLHEALSGERLFPQAEPGRALHFHFRAYFQFSVYSGSREFFVNNHDSDTLLRLLRQTMPGSIICTRA